MLRDKVWTMVQVEPAESSSLHFNDMAELRNQSDSPGWRLHSNALVSHGPPKWMANHQMVCVCVCVLGLCSVGVCVYGVWKVYFTMKFWAGIFSFNFFHLHIGQFSLWLMVSYFTHNAFQLPADNAASGISLSLLKDSDAAVLYSFSLSSSLTYSSVHSDRFAAKASTFKLILTSTSLLPSRRSLISQAESYSCTAFWKFESPLLLCWIFFH